MTKKVRTPPELPPEIEQKFAKAVRIERWSLAFMISGVIVIYLTLGQSEAMKAVLVEDILAVIPPAAYLIAQKIRWREPNDRHPYGYQRSVSIAFLISAASLLGLGLFMLLHSSLALIHREHPTVGAIGFFGRQIWLGWLTIPALLYTITGEFLFGKIKTPYAGELHDTALAADARMNRADWMSGAVGIAGILGIAVGWWWADAAAAVFISFEIARDGLQNFIAVLRDLMDEMPAKVEEGDRGDWAERLTERMRQLDWVERCEVRLREEGNLITGEVFVVPRTTENITRRYDEVQKLAHRLDWRFYDLAVVAVDAL